jgi:hypothetical protein
MEFYLSVIFSLLAFTSLSVEAQSPSQLKPFETDGCTMFLDGTKEKPELWKHCCTYHDLRYWYGGTLKDQDQSDLKLKQCVEKVAGTKWANLIYTGVRAGHYSPIKNKYAWAWGWNPKRDKDPLSSADLIYVKQELLKLKDVIKDISVEEFIKNEIN